MVTDYNPEDSRNYFAYDYACQVAIVEVDMVTGTVQIKKVFAFRDVGKELNHSKSRTSWRESSSWGSAMPSPNNLV